METKNTEKIEQFFFKKNLGTKDFVKNFEAKNYQILETFKKIIEFNSGTNVCKSLFGNKEKKMTDLPLVAPLRWGALHDC